MLNNILSDSDFKQLAVLFFIKAAFNFALFIIILAWSGEIMPYMVLVIIMILSDGIFSGYSIFVELERKIESTDRREKLCNSISSITNAYEIIPYFVICIVLWTHFVALKNIGKAPKLPKRKKKIQGLRSKYQNPKKLELSDSDHYSTHQSSYSGQVGFNQDLDFHQSNSAINYFRKNVTNVNEEYNRPSNFNIKSQRALSSARRNPNNFQNSVAVSMPSPAQVYENESEFDPEDDVVEYSIFNPYFYWLSLKEFLDTLGWGAIALEKSQNPRTMVFPGLIIWLLTFAFSYFQYHQKKYYDYITESCTFILMGRGVTLISLSVILSIIFIPIMYLIRSFLEWWLDLGNWNRKEKTITKKKTKKQKEKEMSLYREGRGSRSLETAIQITDILTEPVDILIDILSTYRNFFRLWIWYIIYGLIMFFDRFSIENVPVFEFNALWIAYIDSYAAYFVISIYPKLFTNKSNKEADRYQKLCITRMSEYSMWTSLFEILHDPTPNLDRKFMIFICHLLQFMFLGLKLWHHMVTSEPGLKKILFFSKNTPLSVVSWLIGFLIVETYLVK